MLITNINAIIPFAPNFMISEFWKGIDFELDDSLIKAAQIFRDWWGSGCRIVCTLRPSDGWGYHVERLAVDIAASDTTRKLEFLNSYDAEIMKYYKGEGSGLIEKLRKVGITGFGLEAKGCHYDKRPQNVCNLTDQYGNYKVFVWDGYIDPITKKVISTKNYSLPPYKK